MYTDSACQLVIVGRKGRHSVRGGRTLPASSSRSFSILSLSALSSSTCFSSSLIRSSFSFSAAAPAAGRPAGPAETDERVERDEPGRAVGAAVVAGRVRAAVVVLGVVEDERGLRAPAPAVIADLADVADESGGLAVETIPPAGRSRAELSDERRGARVVAVELAEDGGGLVADELEAEERVEGRRACPTPGAGAPVVVGRGRRAPLTVVPAVVDTPEAAVRLTPPAPAAAPGPATEGLPAAAVVALNGRRVVPAVAADVGGAPGRALDAADVGGRAEGRFVAVAAGLVGAAERTGATPGTGGARVSGSAAPLTSVTGLASATGGGTASANSR